jgi:hypothetical protein
MFAYINIMYWAICLSPLHPSPMQWHCAEPVFKSWLSRGNKSWIVAVANFHSGDTRQILSWQRHHWTEIWEEISVTGCHGAGKT